jgi:signal transduction histidine kinase
LCNVAIMPVSRTVFLSSTALFILLGLAALLAIVGETFWLVAQSQVDLNQVTSARQQRAAVIDLRAFAQDAETGQRGYLLTGDEGYLKPYLDAEQRLPAEIERARSLLSGDPEEAAAFERLSETLTAKMAEIKHTLDLDHAGRHDAAVAIVRTDLGRNLMDEARDLLARLTKLTEARIVDRLQAQRSNIANLRTITIISAVAIVLFALASLRSALNYTRQLIEARGALSALNASLEERVRERTVELKRANDEIQRFAYVVTHDLRAPLVNIMGFASELEAGLAAVKAHIPQEGAGEQPAAIQARQAAWADMPEAIGFILSSTKKMDKLINAILKLSREGRRTLRPERIELDALLRGAVENIRHQLNEAGGEVAIEGNAPSLVSDRLALEQIFGNLLDNAAKYGQPGRPLRIQIRARNGERGRVVVEVEDNGRGVASVDHERIFDLFRRAGARDQPGEGIGLPHVRAIVRHLGGEIALRSELGKGTTFAVSVAADLREIVGAT